MASELNFSVVMDVGTSSLTTLAGCIGESGKMQILASAKCSAKGIRRGVIFNVEDASRTIKELLSGLEEKLDASIDKVDIAYAGQPMKVFNFETSRLTSEDGIVSQADVDELLRSAEQQATVDAGFKVLHIIPQSYFVDKEPAGINPVGLMGQNIEVKFKVIAVLESYLSGFKRVLNMAGYELGDVTLSPLVAAGSALSEDEKEMGAVLLDIGAGTTKLAVYHEGVMVHTAIIPFGGDVVTNDIKEGCCILPKWAEQLKVQYGQALGDFADDRKMVTIPGQHGWEPREISFKSLAFIIQARMEELIDSVNYQIDISGIRHQLGSGIVLAGGATTLQNLTPLVKYRTGMDVRNGFSVIKPLNGDGVVGDPDFLVALGLLAQSIEKRGENSIKKVKKERKKRENRFSPWLKGVVQGVLDYVDDDSDTVLN